MNKRVLGVIGLVAGAVALVGVFTPWVTLSGWGASASASAWDSITKATVAGGQVDREGWAILGLVGAALLLVGALSVLVGPKIKALWGIVVIGGVVAIVGSVWGLADIETGSILGLSVSYGYGLYLTLVGGILGLSGALGFRG